MSEPNLSAVRALLDRVFPDPHAKLAEDAIDLILRALPEDAQKSLVGEVLSAAGASGYPPGPPDPAVLGYWRASATHTRLNPNKQPVHSFVGSQPLVHVLLGEKQEDIATQIGIVYAGDHLRYTRPMCAHRVRSGLEALAQKLKLVRPAYAEACEAASKRTSSRVELITAARYFGARFAPLSLELHSDDAGVFAYRLEFGLATGQPVIDLVSPITDATEPRTAWYEPTPFADDAQQYSCWVDFDHQGAPSGVIVLKSNTGEPPHLHITTTLERFESPPSTDWPAQLTAEMVLRVCVVAKRIGKEIPGVPTLIRDALAEVALRTLAWEA